MWGSCGIHEEEGNSDVQKRAVQKNNIHPEMRVQNRLIKKRTPKSKSKKKQRDNGREPDERHEGVWRREGGEVGGWRATDGDRGVWKRQGKEAIGWEKRRKGKSRETRREGECGSDRLCSQRVQGAGRVKGMRDLAGRDGDKERWSERQGGMGGRPVGNEGQGGEEKGGSQWGGGKAMSAEKGTGKKKKSSSQSRRIAPANYTLGGTIPSRKCSGQQKGTFVKEGKKKAHHGNAAHRGKKRTMSGGKRRTDASDLWQSFNSVRGKEPKESEPGGNRTQAFENLWCTR